MEIGTVSLNDLIQEKENGGGDATALKNLRAESIEKYKAEMKKAFSKGKLKLGNVNSASDIDTAIKNALEVFIPVKASDMFKAEAMKPSSAAYKALAKAFAANNLADPKNWAGGTNKHKSKFVHFKCDEVVPYVNYTNVASALSNTQYIDWMEPSFLIIIVKAINSLKELIPLPEVLDDLEKVSSETTPYNGAHVDGGELFFVGNIFYYKDYKY